LPLNEFWHHYGRQAWLLSSQKVFFLQIFLIGLLDMELSMQEVDRLAIPHQSPGHDKKHQTVGEWYNGF